MATITPPLSPSRTTCASLLRELQIIWDEIGESDGERDRKLLQLEQECLDIYLRQVEKNRECRASLHRLLAEIEVEINDIASALGECAPCSRGKGALKAQIASIEPVLEDLRSRKRERIGEFAEIQRQIAIICAEIAGTDQPKNNEDLHDLTAKRLSELKLHLRDLQTEKALRLQQVSGHLSSIHELSVVLSFDFSKAVNEVHPSLSKSSSGVQKSISNDTIARLLDLINELKRQKQERLSKLQDHGRRLIELWNLMDTPILEQKRFDPITCLISTRVDDVSKQGCLALQVLEQTEEEVERLNALKASKMRELVFKRQNELEEIYRAVHMDVDSDSARQILNDLIDSGTVGLSDLLSSMDDQIAKAKEQALSRKDILEKLEKWRFASDEENWLEDYERDGNRYSAGRGAHKNLKRAEKARLLVGKIPSMVESLTGKVKAWELDKGVAFLYDKAPVMKTLEEYTTRRLEREGEKRKSREQRRLQDQLAVEQEVLFGSRPTPKKPLGLSTNANTMAGTPIRRATTASGRQGASAAKERRGPANYVALAKEDSAFSNNN